MAEPLDLEALERLATAAKTEIVTKYRADVFAEYLRFNGALLSREWCAFIAAANPTAVLALLQRVREADEYQQKAERVFQAVVYAFEGKPVAADLESHGMVNRARNANAEWVAEHDRLTEALRQAGGEHGSFWRREITKAIREG